MKYLFAVAHPDDEVLGAGAFIYDSIRRGDDVAVAILNSCDMTRYFPNHTLVKDDIIKSHEILGIKKQYIFDFEDSNFHREDHRKMVEQIEYVIRDFEPDTIFTQHPGDINSDHYWTAESVIEAFRVWQRKRGYSKPIEGLYLMEVQSSTDWALNPSENRFHPNTFVEITQDGLEAKINALSVYENVVRDRPHPRSREALRALPVLRGAQAGCMLAEAFECLFRRGIG